MTKSPDAVSEVICAWFSRWITRKIPEWTPWNTFGGILKVISRKNLVETFWGISGRGKTWKNLYGTLLRNFRAISLRRSSTGIYTEASDKGSGMSLEEILE